mmetsp:Transcript_25130/g.62932  ORF Transcript_25130/g.62932 Transcript_25130/m.62932 type:complete len:219 (-) Transcript_25130:469-1125(-)
MRAIHFLSMAPFRKPTPLKRLWVLMFLDLALCAGTCPCSAWALSGSSAVRPFSEDPPPPPTSALLWIASSFSSSSLSSSSSFFCSSSSLSSSSSSCGCSSSSLPSSLSSSLSSSSSSLSPSFFSRSCSSPTASPAAAQVPQSCAVLSALTSLSWLVSWRPTRRAATLNARAASISVSKVPIYFLWGTLNSSCSLLVLYMLANHLLLVEMNATPLKLLV